MIEDELHVPGFAALTLLDGTEITSPRIPCTVVFDREKRIRFLEPLKLPPCTQSGEAVISVFSVPEGPEWLFWFTLDGPPYRSTVPGDKVQVE